MPGPTRGNRTKTTKSKMAKTPAKKMAAAKKKKMKKNDMMGGNGKSKPKSGSRYG